MNIKTERFMSISIICIVVISVVLRVTYIIEFSYVEQWVILLLMIASAFVGYIIKDTLNDSKKWRYKYELKD